MLNSPAGTTTISGQSMQSRKTSPGSGTAEAGDGVWLAATADQAAATALSIISWKFRSWQFIFISFRTQMVNDARRRVEAADARSADVRLGRAQDARRGIATLFTSFCLYYNTVLCAIQRVYLNDPILFTLPIFSKPRVTRCRVFDLHYGLWGRSWSDQSRADPLTSGSGRLFRRSQERRYASAQGHDSFRAARNGGGAGRFRPGEFGAPSSADRHRAAAAGPRDPERLQSSAFRRWADGSRSELAAWGTHAAAS